MAEANYIGVLLWAVVFGIALRDASDRTKQVLGDLSDALSTAIRWVISCAPFGILGLVFTTVSETGFSSFMDYGRLLCVLAGCMFFVALIVNPILVFLCIRRNPYPLVFRCLKESVHRREKGVWNPDRGCDRFRKRFSGKRGDGYRRQLQDTESGVLRGSQSERRVFNL